MYINQMPDLLQPHEEQTDGSQLVTRIMAAEYNLAVQQHDAPQAAGILASILGRLLSR